MANFTEKHLPNGNKIYFLGSDESTYITEKHLHKSKWVGGINIVACTNNNLQKNYYG